MNRKNFSISVAICTLISTVLTGCVNPASLPSSSSASATSTQSTSVPTSKAGITDIYPGTEYQLTKELPTAIRYTFQENGQVYSYITEDPELIEALVQSLSKIKLDLVKMLPPTGNREQIVLCGPSDRYGNIPFQSIDMADGYFITDSSCYSVSKNKSLSENLDIMVQTGDSCDYDFYTDTLLFSFKGYWGTEYSEISISNNENGTWQMNVLTYKDSFNQELDTSVSYVIKSVKDDPTKSIVNHEFTLLKEDGTTETANIIIQDGYLYYFNLNTEPYHRYGIE